MRVIAGAGGGTLIYIDAAGDIVVNPRGGDREVRNAIGGIVSTESNRQ